MRLFALLALIVATTLLPAAEPVVARLAKKSNVRYGPSKAAAIAVTLPSDTAVEILGRIIKDDGVWYQIRFPREGRAWMHSKTIKDVGGNKYEVIEDKARVRDDATGGANIVTELSKGDTVEFRDNRVGAWLAVFPAQAVAYVHESVLAVPQVGVAAVEIRQQAVERLWTVARATYRQYAATQDLAQALTLDWPGLSQQLAEVAKSHPEVAARLEAARLRDGVERVVKEQLRQGVQATVSVPQPAAPTETIPGPVDPQVPVPPVDPLTSLPTPVAGDPPSSPEVERVIAAPAPATSAYLVAGILEQRGELFVVYNNSGKVVAVLQAKPGATLQLSDYYWREIGVKGTSPGNGKDDQGNDVPIVLVDDIELIKR